MSLPTNTLALRRSVRSPTMAGAALLWAALIALALAAPATARAEAETAPVLTIDGQQFHPKELTLPPGQKVKLTIRNKGSLPAEFESYDLSREVVVPVGGEATVYVGPLEAGRYEFFNDFNQSMRGAVVVKPTDANAPGGQ
ncbi:MAG: cupredoxin domain-containing protein [Gammaproteobacteria bacterium]